MQAMECDESPARRLLPCGEARGVLFSSMENGSASFEFLLNGERVRVAGVAATTTLLDWLRATGRTGSKQGCAEGDCGACSVALVEGDASGKATYRAINSCIALLPMLAGREVVTVEGLAGGTGMVGKAGGVREQRGLSRKTASGAGGDGGALRLAMRLLHAGFRDGDVRGLLPRRGEVGGGHQ